eukprot:gene904-1418_t
MSGLPTGICSLPFCLARHAKGGKSCVYFDVSKFNTKEVVKMWSRTRKKSDTYNLAKASDRNRWMNCKLHFHLQKFMQDFSEDGVSPGHAYRLPGLSITAGKLLVKRCHLTSPESFAEHVMASEALSDKARAMISANEHPNVRANIHSYLCNMFTDRHQPGMDRLLQEVASVMP